MPQRKHRLVRLRSRLKVFARLVHGAMEKSFAHLTELQTRLSQPASPIPIVASVKSVAVGSKDVQRESLFLTVVVQRCFPKGTGAERRTNRVSRWQDGNLVDAYSNERESEVARGI